MASLDLVTETTSRPLVRPLSLSAGLLAWIVVAGLFLLLRLGPVWRAPVGGAELPHLSGAWEAHLGHDDARFVPTLLQALAATSFQFSTSEVPARTIAFAATATIPLALWRLRPLLGEGGALVALALLAFDGPGIAMGSTASAMGWDLAIACWLLVALAFGAPWWAWGGLAFLVAGAGPMSVPLVAGGVAVWAFRGRPAPPRPAAIAAATGVAAAVLLASVRYGLGDLEVRVPALDLFAAGYEEDWSTASTASLAWLYSWPVLLMGAAAIAWWAASPERLGLARDRALVPAWAGFALAWLLSSLGSHNPAVLAATTLPLALALGPAAVAAVEAMLRADWREARWLIPVALFCLLVAAAFVVDWARVESVTDGEPQVLFLALVATAALVAVAARGSLAALAAPALLLALPLVIGAIGVALSYGREPLPSSISPDRARELRHLALEAAAGSGGWLVIHADLEPHSTWAFRDSGEVVFAARIPPEATVVVWLAGLPPPPGFDVVDGQWALLDEVQPPTGSLLDYLHWLVDRNSLAITPERVAVYTRSEE